MATKRKLSQAIVDVDRRPSKPRRNCHSSTKSKALPKPSNPQAALLGLPYELRERIYQFTLYDPYGPPLILSPRAVEDTDPETGCCYFLDNPKYMSQNYLRLLSINKQIRAETTTVGLKWQTSIRFTKDCDAQDIFRHLNTLSTASLALVERINIPHYAFNAINIDGCAYWPKLIALMETKLPNLQNLQIFLPEDPINPVPDAIDALVAGISPNDMAAIHEAAPVYSNLIRASDEEFFLYWWPAARRLAGLLEKGIIRNSIYFEQRIKDAAGFTTLASVGMIWHPYVEAEDAPLEMIALAAAPDYVAEPRDPQVLAFAREELIARSLCPLLEEQTQARDRLKLTGKIEGCCGKTYVYMFGAERIDDEVQNPFHTRVQDRDDENGPNLVCDCLQHLGGVAGIGSGSDDDGSAIVPNGG